VAQPSRKADPLVQARQALADTEELITKLEAERMTVLLGDDDACLAAAVHQRRTDADRVTAREAEAEAKASRERLAQIGRLENRFRERDRIGAELAQDAERRMPRHGKMVALPQSCNRERRALVKALAGTILRDGRRAA
jgi:hypothetical protein